MYIINSTIVIKLTPTPSPIVPPIVPVKQKGVKVVPFSADKISEHFWQKLKISAVFSAEGFYPFHVLT